MNRSKHFFGVLLLLAVLLAALAVSAAAANSGTCGAGLTWTLDNAGTLTVSGTGSVKQHPWSDYDYDAQNYAQRETIKAVVIEPGVTALCDSAFQSCTALTTVTLPESLTVLGNYAFLNCTSLKSVRVPSKVTEISNFAFAGCSALKRVELPAAVTAVGEGAFDRCTALKAVLYGGSQEDWTALTVSRANDPLKTAAVKPGEYTAADESLMTEEEIDAQKAQVKAEEKAAASKKRNQWFKYFGIGAGALLLLVILIAVLAGRGKKRRRARRQAEIAHQRRAAQQRPAQRPAGATQPRPAQRPAGATQPRP
ncbi:MAG: leucine-rich repeat domain-containing protein, partial [Clostridia bacterium]|nr:leucine-rich repeat domain-containing protein [Clostridia bacterium]